MDLTALHQIGYGIYIISSKKENKINGQIANTVFQITSEPPTIAISINKENYTHECISHSKVFAVSVLEQDVSMKFIGKFGFICGRDEDKFTGIKYKIGVTGSPIILDNTLAFLEAEVVQEIDVGTHTLFVGKIVNAGNIKKGIPLTYNHYHEIKKGISPKAAPTYIPPTGEKSTKEKKEKEFNKMKKFKCTVCGYVYDPEKGDPESGITPGTSFAELPDDWECPICGVGKDEFEEMK